MWGCAGKKEDCPGGGDGNGWSKGTDVFRDPGGSLWLGDAVCIPAVSSLSPAVPKGRLEVNLVGVALARSGARASMWLGEQGSWREDSSQKG